MKDNEKCGKFKIILFLGLLFVFIMTLLAIIFVVYAYKPDSTHSQVFVSRLIENVDYDPKDTVLVALAEGVEEIEFIVPLDVLRRLGGVESVVAVKIGGKRDNLQVVGANGGKIVADLHISDVFGTYKAIVVPGGMGGSEVCGSDTKFLGMLRRQLDSGRLTAAICAAPVLVLGNNGLLKGKTKATCYPSMNGMLPDFIDGEAKSKPVVVDGNLVTSQGPGTSYAFAMTIAEQLYGEKRVSQLISGMVVNKWW